MRNKKQLFGLSKGLPLNVISSSPGEPNRIAAEQFVHRCFEYHYQANVQHFMPILMSLCDEQDRLQAVLGFRHAEQTPLFLETYLDSPAEQMIAKQINQPVDRSTLVEVGNLTAANTGIGRWLFIALTAYLSTTHCEWVLFTVGPILQNAFRNLGFELIDLGEASIERLPEAERDAWGSYYAQKPRVMAGKLAQGHATLRSMCEKEVSMMNLWHRAVAVGRQAA
ncbi:MAG: thermostable hemolysin [Candidatus Thiodiazotropha sp.]|jgi:hypothetical protein